MGRPTDLTSEASVLVKRDKNEEVLTEIDELLYRERRRVELRIKVQHLADVAETVPGELHLASPYCYTLNSRSKSRNVARRRETRTRRSGHFYRTADDVQKTSTRLS